MATLKTQQNLEYKKYHELEQMRLAMLENVNHAINPQLYSHNNSDNENTTTASSTTQPYFAEASLDKLRISGGKPTQSTEIFSINVLDKYQTIKETTLYTQYQNAKQLHEANTTNDTHRIMCDSLSELVLTQKWEHLVLAMRQEKLPLNNIIQSEKWVAEQTYSAFPHLKGRLPTKELQNLQLKLVDFLCNKLETQLSLTQHHARKTNNNNNNFGITIQPYSRTNSDCFIEHTCPKIDIPLTSLNNNNNYSPRETCVPHNLQLKLTNNNNNNNEK